LEEPGPQRNLAAVGKYSAHLLTDAG